LLIVSATEERIVSCEAQKRFCRQAPDCRLVEIPAARHEVLVETDALRRLFWEAFDRFVGLKAPPDTDGHPVDASPAAWQCAPNRPTASR
jgi:lysophospholipase